MKLSEIGNKQIAEECELLSRNHIFRATKETLIGVFCREKFEAVKEIYGDWDVDFFSPGAIVIQDPGLDW